MTFQNRTFILSIEFHVPWISSKLFWFIQHAICLELKYIGHLMGIDITTGYNSIQEVPESWEEVTIPSEAEESDNGIRLFTGRTL